MKFYKCDFCGKISPVFYVYDIWIITEDGKNKCYTCQKNTQMEKKLNYYKKRIEKLKKEKKEEKTNLINALNNMRDLREEENALYEKEIGKLNQLIGIMKTGRIRYEKEIEVDIQKPFKIGEYEVSLQRHVVGTEVQKISGILFLNELQQVEVRKDDVLLVTKSGREILLSKEYDYLEKLFLSHE